MKALAIDSAVSKLTISAKNDDKSCTAIFNIGMKQSETLLPAIDYVLTKCGLNAADLDYMTLSEGPGSFTGLRLAYSALKAIECAFNKPIYGISSLYVHAFPFLEENKNILSCIDANKDKFYAGIYNNSSTVLKDGDYSFEELNEKIKNLDTVYICGPDKDKFSDLLKQSNTSNTKIIKYEPVVTDVLFELAEAKIANNEQPLQEYDGPVYLRASEAEIVHQNKEK